MKTTYVGTNQYRIRWFKNIFKTKVLIDCFIGPNFINMTEIDLHKDASDDLAINVAKMKIREIESYV